MKRALEHLRGITPEECERLRGLRVHNTNELLHVGSLRIDRDRLSRKSGISEPRLLALVKQCGLLEISGIDLYSDALWRLGVVSAADLKRAEPAELHAGVVRVVGPARAPTRQMVEYWVSQARCIDIVEVIEDPRPSLPAHIG